MRLLPSFRLAPAPAAIPLPAPILALALLAAGAPCLHAQQSIPQPSTTADIPRTNAPTPPPIPLQFNARFSGNWAGTLEYRDYKATTPDAPHTSLPTLLTMTPSPDGRAINFLYTYQDGPAPVTASNPTGKKVVRDRTILAFTGATALLTGTTTAENQVFAVQGMEAFARTGLGTLVLTGQGKENDKPADFRITITLDATSFSWVKESRPAGTQAGYAFRDAYHLARL